MSAHRHGRRLVLLVVLAAIVTTLGVQAPGTAATGRVASYTPPTGAGEVYKWGNALWREEFEVSGPLERPWASNRPGLVEYRYGMLTLKGRPDGRQVTTTFRRHAHRYGRWEARVRVRDWEDARMPYRVIAELIPAGDRDYHCGARNIVFADYVNGSDRAHLSIRTLPDREFTYSATPYSGSGQWNTYAVEVTRKHIAWFVDDRVVMTERRSAALSGVVYALRFRIVGDGPTQLRPPWMQMDWTRHHTLERRNALSIRAPRAQAGTYAAAC